MKSSIAWLSLLTALVLALAPAGTFAQTPSPAPTVAAAVLPNIAPDADAATATRAWLATVPPDKREKSDSYFEGGYWLILWNFLLGSAISLLLLGTRLSARMRDFAERTTRFRPIQVVLYAVPYLLLTTLLSFPLTVYEQYFREHKYGLATQSFGPWFGDQMKGLAIGLVGISLLLMALYAVFRRAPKTWWIWGTVVVVIFLMLGVMVAPVYIEPLFNKYKPLENPEISRSILAMAAANEIPVTQVFEVDASRQSNRVSANVSGFLGTTRIALNDNLLKQSTLPEIRYVMAHEMGHFVLNHIMKFIVLFGLITLIAFALAKWAFEACVRCWGDRWGVRGIADLAGVPLLALIFGSVGFLLTPVNNTITRTQEIEADAFGINTSREPIGMAQAALKLGTYRKLDPTPMEEFIFFDHPSGRNRIRMAMDWKAANLPCGSVGSTTP